MKHLDIRVHGRVQGVFFRATTRQKARELGVKGFVRNEPDGTVYIEAEGDQDTLDQFVDWCYEGSPSARVEHVETGEGEVQSYDQFKIAH